MKNIGVNFIYSRWAHHAGHSGYDQIVPILGRQLKSIQYEKPGSRIIPWKLANFFVYQYAGIRHYGHAQFYAEFSAALAMIHSKREIYHYLYGDFDYRYLGHMNKARGNHIVATYHLPPSSLDELISHHDHYQSLSALIIVGSNQRQYFQQFVPPSKIHCIPHGIDTRIFHPSTLERLDRKQRCLFVGRHLRDLVTLKEVVEKLTKYSNEIETVIVSSDKEIEQDFQKIPGVIVRNTVSDAELVALYQSSDLFLLPLVDATAVNSLLEAMACGLPAVVTDVGAVNDYVDPTCAVLVPKSNPEAMYRAVQSLLSDQDARQRLGRTARNRAIQYDWTVVTQQVAAIYQKVLSE